MTRFLDPAKERDISRVFPSYFTLEKNFGLHFYHWSLPLPLISFFPQAPRASLALDSSLLVLYKLVEEQLGRLPLLAAMQDNNELDGILEEPLKELQVSGSLLPLPFASRPGLFGSACFLLMLPLAQS
jgi:hypothetical protein